MQIGAVAACAVLLALAGLLAGASLSPTSAEAGPAAFCTAAQKRAAQRAHTKFRKSMPARRRAYFKKVKNAKRRAAFVRSEKARLKRLQTKAACRVRRTTTTKPTTSTTTPPPARPDLAVSVTPPTAGAMLHQPFTVTVQVVNRGTASAADAVLVDSLPATLRRVGAGSCEGITVIRCPLGTIEPGGSRAVELTLRPLATGTTTHILSVTSPMGDAVPADNSTAASVMATPLPSYATPASTGFSFQLSRPAWADTTPFPPIGEWPKTPGLFASATGTLRGAVVFVDFPNYPGSGSTEETLALLETDAQAWYREASYGRLTLDLVSAGGWFRMSKPAEQYGVASCCIWDNVRAFAAEAIALADATFDFSQTDVVWVVAPASAESQVRILVSQRWPGEGVTADGRELRRWITAPASYPSVPTQIEPARFSHWIVTHELGHILGLPDIYYKPPAGPNTFELAGWWDLLSDVQLHAHFMAWHKWLLGWLDPAQLREVPAGAGSYVEETLTPLAAPGGLKAIVAPVSANKAYVVESRAPLGWESLLCDRGALVYTVDSSKGNADGPVEVKAAHGLTTSPTCGPIFDAAFALGAGEVPAFEDGTLRVEVLQELPDGSCRVRVTRK
jgi:M6 family metalloprotease-like protein